MQLQISIALQPLFIRFHEKSPLQNISFFILKYLDLVSCSFLAKFIFAQYLKFS